MTELQAQFPAPRRALSREHFGAVVQVARPVRGEDGVRRAGHRVLWDPDPGREIARHKIVLASMSRRCNYDPSNPIACVHSHQLLLVNLKMAKSKIVKGGRDYERLNSPQGSGRLPPLHMFCINETQTVFLYWSILTK